MALADCDGMRDQLAIRGGNGKFWGIAGVSVAFVRSSYCPSGGLQWSGAILALSASILAVFRFPTNMP